MAVSKDNRNLLRRVVTKCNKARRAYGKAPITRMPKGRPGKADRCPLKNALDGDGVRVGRMFAAFRTKRMAVAAKEAWDTRFGMVLPTEIRTSDSPVPIPSRLSWTKERPSGWYLVELPADLVNFVEMFDRDVFPHLVEEA